MAKIRDLDNIFQRDTVRAPKKYKDPFASWKQKPRERVDDQPRHVIYEDRKDYVDRMERKKEFNSRESSVGWALLFAVGFLIFGFLVMKSSVLIGLFSLLLSGISFWFVIKTPTKRDKQWHKDNYN